MSTPDQCPQCGKGIIGQQPPVLVDGKVVKVTSVTITHPDKTICVLPANKVPWLYQRPPVFWKLPGSEARSNVAAVRAAARARRSARRGGLASPTAAAKASTPTAPAKARGVVSGGSGVSHHTGNELGADRTSHLPTVPVPVLEVILQAINIDRYMQEILGRLEEAGHPAHGILIGIMHDGETSASWAVSDQVRGDDGKPSSDQSIAHQIARDLVHATEATEGE